MLVSVARIAGRHFRHSRTLFVSAPSASSSDPWPLPHTPQHLSSTTTPADLPAPEPLPRLNESIETTRARLLYQSRKRGTLESDLLLSTFARDHLPTMIHAELTEYDKLLDEPDWDIYYWSTGNRTPPERWSDSPILEKLKVHAKNEGKVVRKMPPLE
ncbi:mitochondrial protein [Boletus reticuloceps]|uniref:Succinate dehydrogenase assembly factor 2, mitochondrial n=1 Tax=Boletus reticuloceps TaxID=495285 RepID=A0A8I3AA76_9AGAM|nr:mitochondrial protein [Boletus reticuloceps]